MIKGGIRLFRDQFGIIWNLQRFPILQTRNWFWLDTNHIERILLIMKIGSNNSWKQSCMEIKKNHSNWLSTWTDGIVTGLWVLENSTVSLEIWGLPVFILCVCRSLFHQYLEYCSMKIKFSFIIYFNPLWMYALDNN